MNKHNDLQQRLAQRTLASLSLFIIVCVVVVTGIIAFLRPFSITAWGKKSGTDISAGEIRGCVSRWDPILGQV